MTFYAHLVFFWLLKMPWMLQLFLVQEKATQQLLSVVLQKVQKRAGNIRRYHTVCFIPQCLSRSGCFVCRLDIWNKLTVFVLQHIMYYTLQKIFCAASHKKCIKHIVMVTISTHWSWTQAIDNNINMSICGSLVVVPKHGLAMETILKKRYCSCT